MILDGTDLFPGGVPFNMTSIGLANNSAYVGFTGATGGSYENNDILSWTFTPQSFGDINVCPSGTTTPAPCSNTLPVTFNIAGGHNHRLGQGRHARRVRASTSQVASSGDTASGPSPGRSLHGQCHIRSDRARIAHGRGGATSTAARGNLVATQLIYGIGQGPAVAFGPGTQTTVGSGLTNPYSIAEDAAGDIFIADWGDGRVVKIAAGGGAQTNLISGRGVLEGVAVDGAGNVYTAEQNTNSVLEIPAGGGPPITVGSGLNNPAGVAVDGTGNVFIADYYNNRVVEVPAGGGPQTTVGSGLNVPQGVAVDGLGDVIIADSGNGRVVEVTASGTQTTLPFTGLSDPIGVAVDAAGDVFVTNYHGGNAMELTPAGAETILPAAGLGTNIVGVGLDPAGDIFIADIDNSRVVELQRSQAPWLSFAATVEGIASADSVVSVQNVGNQTLTGSVAPASSPFGEDSGSSCDAFSLAAGATCSELFNFTPEATGLLVGTAIFSDNSLNAAPATQSVALSGTGLTNQTGTIPNVVGMTQAAAITALGGAGFVAGTVSSEYSDSEPAGSVIGEDPGAGAQAYLGSAVALMVSTGAAPAPTPNPLTFENNFFVTGDFATAGVTLRGTGVGGTATGTINIPDLTAASGNQGVPDGADIIDGFVYWTTLENTATPSANTGTFLGYPITGQQIGSDVPLYNDGSYTGTLRVYRADVNAYFQVNANWNGARQGSGAFTVTFPDSGGGGDPTGFPITEGASLVVIYRVLSPNFPLKGVVVYDGSAIPSTSRTTSARAGIL